MNFIIAVFLVGQTLSFLLHQILEFVDFRYRNSKGKEIPQAAKDFITPEKNSQAIAYENEKYYFWIVKSILFTAVTISLVVCGFYPWTFSIISRYIPSMTWTLAVFFVVSGIPETFVSIPFDLYREFKIERKYGFSKMTLRLYFVDTLKDLLVSGIIMLPLFLLAQIIVTKINLWWLLLSAVVIVFSLGLSFIYPVFIAPLFNKFTPIEDQQLKERLEKLLERTGFKASGIFVMDASKRSGHSNAYFTGFGKNKRIVLYDTLMQQLTPEELEAVLAHELGHYRHHHVLKRMLTTIPLTLAGTFIISFIVRLPEIYEALGFSPIMLGTHSVNPNQTLLGIFIVSLVLESLGFILAPVVNSLSRRDEFQADKFSAELMGSGEPLASALIKLNRENLSELTVPKVYSLFYYNHPPLLDRINAIQK